ncbi:methyl-accepting chemotaxis protein [Undibacterium sp. TJN19]|uniref:methyl-accepting chemotaxis protein n=1 Tax=Undibacterium sp. TJN19 TaxID=3413055 RepID=UPI003BF27B20
MTILSSTTSPAIHFFRNFKIARKFSFVAIAFAIPLLVVLALLFQDLRLGVLQIHEKQIAIQKIADRNTVRGLLQKQRALTHMRLIGNKQLDNEIAGNQGKLEQKIELLNNKEQIKSLWKGLQGRQSSLKAVDNFAGYSKLIAILDMEITNIANTSKLTLDSDLKTHQLANSYVHTLPQIEEKIAIIAGRGAAYIDSGLFEAGEDVMLNSLHMLARHELSQLTQLMQDMGKSNPAYAVTSVQIQEKIADVKKYLDRSQDEVLASVNQTSGTAFFQAGIETLERLSMANTAIAELVNANLAKEIDKANQSAWKMSAGIILLLLIASYFLTAIYLALTRDLNLLTQAIAQTAAGNLQHEISSKGKDELAHLINAVGRMNAGLSEMVANIRNSALTVDIIAREIHDENTDLASRTESQASALQQTASTIDELTATITENAGNLAQANSLIHTSAERVQQGLEVMDNTILSIQTVTASSKKISEIIGVMDGIAFQTNILALNAAVEAARAGQEGRGFAVVAAEVRNLAQRSTNAAREIKQLIAASGKAVEDGSSMINAAGKTMQDIAVNVDVVTELIRQIADASQEQSTGISQVNEAIADIDQITQDNTRLVDEATESTARLEEQAALLGAAVSVFKTKQSVAEVPELHLANTSHQDYPLDIAIQRKERRKLAA